MREGGGRTRPIVAADTNVLSAVALGHPGAAEGFFGRFGEHVVGISPYTLFELRQSPAAYGAFLEVFGRVPCAVLKTEEMLFEDERAFYPRRRPVDPVLARFSPPDMSLADALELLLPDAVRREAHAGWPALRRELLEEWLALKPHFEPAAARYRPSDGMAFVDRATVRRVRALDSEWAESLDAAGAAIDPRAFPSIRMTLWTLFFRRYWAEPRKYGEQDAFDALISSPAPYVDAVVTENFQADIYRKVAALEPSLLHLQAFTLTDVRRVPGS